ncbi:hypothetical protein TELCIR_10187 [Teladorsagia circumcincta]|uniref:Uncharacterized protein n=1 Tax=Teladorsagia circumcincta TaxID=45464 RepID=A0A2G9UE79_TELCI|nr:hypothetical protein TELCIR_10187 [Teladorsagia circumcincta]
MANPESRPTFTMLHDRFLNFCRIPHLYVVDQTAPQAFIETESQRDLLRELLNDTENDFTDPLNYFETCENPDTPTSDFDGAFEPRNVRRLQSTSSSHRYQTDPMLRPIARPSEVGMDDGNYLIPNAKLLNEHATMYTPVVVNETGATGPRCIRLTFSEKQVTQIAECGDRALGNDIGGGSVPAETNPGWGEGAWSPRRKSCTMEFRGGMSGKP